MHNEQAPGGLEAWWTPERIRRALAHPADLPAASASTGSGQPRPDGAPQGVLSADAVGPKAGSGEVSGVTAVSRSQRVKYSSAWPNVVTGKLLYAGGACSAAVIVSNNKNTVWTAGHCVYDRKNKRFRKNFAFLPAYKNGQRPWDLWEYARAYVPQEYIDSGDVRWSDLGAIVLRRHRTYGNIQDKIGAYGYRFGGGPNHSNVQAAGYPYAGYNRPDRDFAAGEYMMYCRGNTTDASRFNPRDNRLRMACDMGRGASGGPQVIGIASNPQIVGANSHRNVSTSGAYRDLSLYSSEHTTLAKAVINTAGR
ncbi:trypsin-like serine peptidase [Streptomyces sp. NPDC086023]|uniref:trypsin-like serine peptidase n=1 Tax=Streptomyces sp. NPDC086023 TaxID=3365746 RepID=UPI0037D55597